MSAFLCVCVFNVCTRDVCNIRYRATEFEGKSKCHTQDRSKLREGLMGWGGSSLLARLSAGLCGAGCLSVWKHSAPLAHSSYLWWDGGGV